MTETDYPYQPGAILHDAILGALKARGRSFGAWLEEHGEMRQSARAATFGLGQGPKARSLLARLIEAAGPDVVRVAYLAQMQRNIEEVRRHQPRVPAEEVAEVTDRHNGRRAS